MLRELRPLLEPNGTSVSLQPVKTRRAMALVMVVWAAVLLTTVALPAVDVALAHRRLSAGRIERLRTRLAARAALERAIARLALDDPEIDGLADSWAAPDDSFTVVDEDRKLLVHPSRGTALRKCPGMTPAAFSALFAAISTDDESRFLTMSTMLRLPPLEPVYARVAEHLTLYTDGRLNVNTAAADLLAASGALTAQQAGRVVETRGRLGQPYRSLEEVARTAGAPPTKAEALEAALKLHSKFFKVVTAGNRIEAVVERDGGRLELVFYQGD